MPEQSRTVSAQRHNLLVRWLMEIFSPSISTRSSSSFRILDVGYDGVLAALLHEEFKKNAKRSLEIVAIQQNKNIEKVPGVNVVEGNLLSFQNDRLFDAIIFEESLRTAKPLSEVIIRSKMLLKEGGYMISEELSWNHKADKETYRWFFESMDLLEMSSIFKWPYSPHLKQKQEKELKHSSETSSAKPKRPGHKKNSKSVSDTVGSLFGSLRGSHRRNQSTVQEGDVSEASPNGGLTSSHSSEKEATTNYSPASVQLCAGIDYEERWHRFYSGDKELNLVSGDALINHLKTIYGPSSVEVRGGLPYFYHFLAMGLDDNPKSSQVLTSFMENEQKRIDDHVITPVGLLLIAKNA